MKRLRERLQLELCALCGGTLFAMPAALYFVKDAPNPGTLFVGVMVSAMTIGSGVDDLIHAISFKRTRSAPGGVLLAFLSVLRWPCSKETREHLDLLLADLKRDRRAMLTKPMKPWLIRILLYCAALRSVLPIVLRGLAALLAIEELVRKIIGRK